jgi:hypothetical protein
VQPYLSLGAGWGPRLEADGAVSRAIAGAAEVFVHHRPADQPLTLAISATAPSPQILTVSTESGPLGTIEVGPDGVAAQIALPTAVDLLKLRLTPAPGGAVNVTRLSLSR